MRSYNFNSTPDTTQNYNTPFLALITDEQKGNDSGPWVGLHMYSWIEQTIDGTGLPINASPARSGSYVQSTDKAIQPAIEVNNLYIQPGTYVYVKPKAFVNDIFIYEIVDFTPDTFVLVTSDKANGDGWYEGLVQYWDEDLQDWFIPDRYDVTAQDWVEGDCWIRDANDAGLAKDMRYAVTYTGLYSFVQSYVTSNVPLAGCFIKIFSGSINVDTEALITPGGHLMVVHDSHDSSDSCETIDVDVSTLGGCNTKYNSSTDTIDIVPCDMIGEGLKCDDDSDACSPFSVDIGCGLEFSPGITIDFGQITGEGLRHQLIPDSQQTDSDSLDGPCEQIYFPLKRVASTILGPFVLTSNLSFAVDNCNFLLKGYTQAVTAYTNVDGVVVGIVQGPAPPSVTTLATIPLNTIAPCCDCTPDSESSSSSSSSDSDSGCGSHACDCFCDTYVITWSEDPSHPITLYKDCCMTFCDQGDGVGWWFGSGAGHSWGLYNNGTMNSWGLILDYSPLTVPCGTCNFRYDGPIDMTTGCVTFEPTTCCSGSPGSVSVCCDGDSSSSSDSHDECTGWYCCPVTNVVTYAADCAALALIECDESSSSGPVPCSSFNLSALHSVTIHLTSGCSCMSSFFPLSMTYDSKSGSWGAIVNRIGFNDICGAEYLTSNLQCTTISGVNVIYFYVQLTCAGAGSGAVGGPPTISGSTLTLSGTFAASGCVTCSGPITFTLTTT